MLVCLVATCRIGWGGEEVGSVAHGLEAAHAAKSVGALAREHEEERAGLHRR